MPSSKASRVALSVLGCLAAWFLGVVAVWAKNRGLSLADQRAASGMFAFGDAVLFLAVVCVMSIAPMISLLSLVDPGSKFWRIVSVLSVLLASSAAIVDVLWLLPAPGARSVLGMLREIAPLRFFAAPLLLLLFLPGVFLSSGESRRRFLIACATELTCAGLVVLVFLSHVVRGPR